MDYQPCSANLNMHFGYCSKGLNPICREALLSEMNQQEYQYSGLDDINEPKEIDLGRGVGATARHCAEHHQSLKLDAITIVPWQIKQAEAMTQALPQANRIR